MVCQREPAVEVSYSGSRSATAVYPEIADSDLMARVAGGDAAALEALHDRYGELVYSAAGGIVRDAQIAEDVSQEVFMSLWRKAEMYRPEKGSFVAWLVSVTHNRALDWVRRRRRRSRYETASPEERELEVPADDSHDPALWAELADLRSRLKAALAQLPRGQRRVIELAYFGGLTQRQVSCATRSPVGTVKTRTRIGLLRLRKLL
jgi:RNA polymerase sigma-70 factor (ECF subfamily)